MNNLGQILTEGIEQLIRDIISASETAGQRASGRTYEKITPEYDYRPGTYSASIYAPVYFATLIRGRGPAPIPANMAELIKEWAEYKGISFSTPEEMIRFANAVAWKIRREGSELYRNHLYVDIVDTPVKIFETWLDSKLDELISIEINRAFDADGFGDHGFII